MLRKTLFWFHLVLGCVAGLVILVMAATGAMLAFEPQIVEYAEKDVRVVSVPQEGERLSLDVLAQKAREANPGKTLAGLTVKSDPTASVGFSFGREGGMYLNPYTGAVLGGDSKTHDVMHVIEDVHRRLALKDAGKAVTGAAAFIFFFIILSGFYLWWPKTWTSAKLASITLFNPKLRGKARDFNWHNVFGFWAMPLLLVSSLTGTVIAYKWANDLVYRVTGNEPPVLRSAAPRGERPAPPLLPAASLDALVASARSKVPSWVSISMRFPNKEGAPLNAFVLESEGFGPPVRSQATLDSSTGELKKWEPYAEANAGRKARTWIRYLHTGDALDLFGQILVFLGAVSAVFLVWTGIALSLRRFLTFRARRKAS